MFTRRFYASLNTMFISCGILLYYLNNTRVSRRFYHVYFALFPAVQFLDTSIHTRCLLPYVRVAYYDNFSCCPRCAVILTISDWTKHDTVKPGNALPSTYIPKWDSKWNPKHDTVRAGNALNTGTTCKYQPGTLNNTNSMTPLYPEMLNRTQGMTPLDPEMLYNAVTTCKYQPRT